MKNIYKKLAALSKKDNKLTKNGHNSFHKYDYITESDVLDKARHLFNEVGLVMSLDVLDVLQVRDDLVRVKVQFTLIDSDSEETLVRIFFGDGQDKGDKGIYKAYTGAVKYFLMKTLMLSTGDDPEQDHKEPLKAVEAKASGFKKIKQPVKADTLFVGNTPLNSTNISSTSTPSNGAGHKSLTEETPSWE